MAKKFFQKALSVGLSLTLCASLVAPSFAAVALNKDLHIDVNGYLKENEEKNYDYYLDQDIELDKTLVIKDGVDASIDLKGNDLKLAASAKGSVISVKGALELDDSTAKTDKDGNYIAGSVTGGHDVFEGGGVYVQKGGSLDLKDGKISGNQAKVGGGVANNGTFNMYDGEISYNKTTYYDGGGVLTWNQATFNMYGGKITHNETRGAGEGAGVSVCNQSTFNMYDGEISYNQNLGSNRIGGGVSVDVKYDNKTHQDMSSDFNMFGGSVIHNTTTYDGTNGVAYYMGTYTEDMEIRKDLAEIHIQISDSAVICNGDGDKARVPEQHDFVNGTATDKNDNVHVVTCPHCEEAQKDGSHTYGAWVTVTAPQIGVAGERKHTCTVCGHEETGTIDALSATPGGTLIDDERVPLAGIFTRGDAVGYLWQQAGEPEAELSDFPDVPEDHEWAVAIGWAQDMGIALADEEGNFRPDDLVLRSTEDIEGEFQEFLNRYAVYAGVELDEGELFIQLEGAADDVIMGEEAQVIFDDFFAKLEAALSQAA